LQIVAGLPDGTYIFKPESPIWVNFVGSCNGASCIFYGHVVYFTAILYILWSFGILYGLFGTFLPFWYTV
jgi:hypothetical protein